ncbi:phage tail protein [Salmonella enterica subsp. enterica serovar Tennessee]|uniref:phage tail fiber protein n=1 Tax=Salmonella enterica TaxID=28901 RepID=UPI00107E2DCF|nr:phage tail protein [Salmonella enterica]EAB7483229.1 phage tail protein [Salmonella enterica subsp. enterica serovar Braenderup]EBH8422077.1 phage tail protein [Salmonella enterica subsp. enterica serovar Isangi]EBX0691119.1 phage tail protein [Salmonella enterica subsp. enterica serovar Tennessee]EEL8155638.1 phage tail protein [Salmonella enterica subsp. enterica serovar Infantis]EGP7049977.1 phage tail protein [Salmonella enterica subsp. enterica serovar Livingstone]
MSAGTLTLTNDTDAVTGSGTAFTAELAAGDFIVVTVGGIPYTLPVKAVNNNTSLTLVSVYTGPTQSGAAWSAVPRVALNMVTAALVAQSAEALRGLNYDKQNWQSIFSGTGNITVKLPDGSAWNGPAWNGITTELNKKANASDLGSAASKNTGLNSGDIMTVGSFGIGAKDGAYAFEVNDFGAVHVAMSGSGLRTYRNNGFLGDGDQSIAQYSPTIWVGTGDTWASLSLPYSPAGKIAVASGSESAGRMVVRLLWDNSNTVVDGNGFIKQASPVVRIFSDGGYETNDESEGVVVTRIQTGEYLIEGCTGLNADAAWGGIDGGFEIPVDRNKLARIWIDYEVNADGSVLVRTYHRVHPSAPPFAQNRIGNTDISGMFTETVADGEPVDIPADSFVSVRVEMPENSIWNKKQEATRIAMEEARMKEGRTDGNNV